MDDAAFLAAVRDNPRATTREVAEAVGVSERAADHRLRELYAEGKVESKTIGNALIWLPVREDGSPDVDDEEPAAPEE
mgnify:CR=1 FL=1